MSESAFIAAAAAGLHLSVQLGLILRVLLHRHLEPAARMAWVIVVVALPLAGILGYLLVGETNIGRRRAERMRRAIASLPPLRTGPAEAAAEAHASRLPDRYAPLFRVGHSISGFAPVGGNRAQLLADSDAAIDALVADIDAARVHVHVLFYIWLPDRNGSRVAEALIRATGRGVVCRALADDLGARRMIRSPHWRRMAGAGVRLARALPVGNPLLRVLGGRIDLRNHRKIAVIDGTVTYCGSQNCADPAFRIKAQYAPWVDAMMRFEGPVAQQNQRLFASDWMTHADDDLDALLRHPPPAPAAEGFTAQVIGTGPTVRHSAMPEMFASLIYSAREELIVTTPYYVPNEAMQAALCASARRGVATALVVPARNDSRVVAAASRSYYAELLGAGVILYEYNGGLLHTKSLTVDGEVLLIGSANMDRRSFNLNYENNILVHDAALTAALRERQHDYIARATRVDPDTVAAWGWRRRLWNNAVAMLGPVL